MLRSRPKFPGGHIACPRSAPGRLIAASGWCTHRVALAVTPVSAAVNSIRRNARRSSGRYGAPQYGPPWSVPNPRPPAQAPGQAARGPVEYLARQIRELGHKDSSNLLARYLKQGPHGGEPPAPVPAEQHAPAHQGRQPHGTSAPHHNARPEKINTKTKMIGRHMHSRAASPPGPPDPPLRTLRSVTTESAIEPHL
jgi:hypothetical protein